MKGWILKLNVFVDAIEHVAEWLNQYGNAVNAVSTIIATAIAVVGIIVSCKSIGVANKANEIAQKSFDYSRKKDRQEAERSQAVLVSAWVTPFGVGSMIAQQRIIVAVCNGGSQPVYNAVVSMGAIQGAAPELIAGDGAVPIGTLPPGKYKVRVPEPPHGMHTKFNASVGFTDSRGLSWTRDAKGNLIQTKEHPYAYFKLSLPVKDLEPLIPADNRREL